MNKYLIFLIVALAGCQRHAVVNHNRTRYENQCNLEYVGEKKFVLDDMTSVMISYMQYVTGKDTSYLSFINEPTNTIYMYNFKDGTLADTIHYELEGNNGVGKIQGYCYLNHDSIFVYGYETNILYMTENGKVLWSKSLYDDKFRESREMLYPAPYLMTSTPMKFVDGKLFLNGFVSGETSFETKSNRPVTTSVDVNSRRLAFLNAYPEQYVKYNWGGGFGYRLPYLDADGKGNLLLSFPADHNLWRYNVKTGQTDSLYAGSREIKRIRPYEATKRLRNAMDESRVMEWYMHTPSYEGIYYDKYRDLYYRIARLPDKEYNIGGRLETKPIVVIVLDGNLNYLGEDVIPFSKKGRFLTNNCFVSEEGLNMQVLTRNDDELVFEQYKVVKDEK